MSSLRLALVQLTSTDAPQDNLKIVLEKIDQALKQEPDLIVFPENTLYMRLSSKDTVQSLTASSPEFRAIRQKLKGTGATALITTPTTTETNKARNSTWAIDSDGHIDEVYSKIHLFDVDVEGAPPVRESDSFEHGSEPRLWQFGDWRIGLTICYDLRFSELFSNYAQVADLILVPSAFLVPTGQAHWHVLLRARAIETQAYVAAPAQAGEHVSRAGSKRLTYGHSLLVDPWGNILSDQEGGAGVQVIEINKDKIEKVRAQIPMGHHRRLI